MKKENSKDFTLNDLPHNHFDMVKDALARHKRHLLLLGLFSFLFLIPALFLFVWRDVYSLTLSYSVQQGQLTQEEAVSTLFFGQSFLFLFLLLAFPIYGMFLSGAFAVLRQIIWQEPLFFFHDFFTGIKESLFSTLLSSFLNAIFFYVALFSTHSSLSVYLRFLPLILYALFLLPFELVILAQTPIYDFPLHGYLQNGVFIFFRHIFSYIGFSFLFLVPFSFYSLQNLFLKYGFVFLYVFLVYPLLLLVLFVYSCYVFDKEINRENYPEIYQKGIYPKGDQNHE